MLQQAVQQVLRTVPNISSSNIFPIQLDFSDTDNQALLRRVLASALDGEPFVASLLGNTLSTFDEDLRVLRSLRDGLLMPDDRLIIDMSTAAQLNEGAALEAAEEYRDSLLFREFATSSLQYYTDLAIDMDSVSFSGEVEERRALKVLAIYRNETGESMRLLLPNRAIVRFPPDDTIRMALMRKYHIPIIEPLVQGQGLRIIRALHEQPASPRRQFGTSVMIAAADG
jgi:hypothetical protein